MKADRDKVDIFASILNVANGGATKRQIIFKSYLSSLQLVKYINILCDRDLLTPEHGDIRVIYKTTDRGLAFLQIYNQINELIEGNDSSMVVKSNK